MAFAQGNKDIQLKNKEVYLEGLKILNEQIIDMEIYFDINKTYTSGNMSFRDVTGMSEKKSIITDSKLELAFKDCNDKEFKQTFSVTNVNFSDANNGEKLVILEFLDTFTVKNMNTYKIKGFEQCTMKEVLESCENFEEFEQDFDTPEQKYDNFIIPLDRPFSHVITYMKNTSNMLFFQTRDAYKLKEFTSLIQEPSNVVYKHSPDNPDYVYKIHEFIVKQSDGMKVNALLPDSSHVSYDVLDKRKIYDDFKSEDYTEGMSLGDVFNETKSDKKHFVKTFYVKDSTIKNQFYKVLYNNYELQMVVPGTLDTNIGDTVEIQINSTSKDDDEKNINGDWIITKITDKHLGDDFMQKIIVSRIKLGKA